MTIGKLSNLQSRLIYSLIFSLVVFFTITAVNFILFRLIPGDPVLATLPPSFTPTEYQDASRALGFHLPIILQYFVYLGKLLTGNLGVSYTLGTNEVISEILAERFFRTFDILFVPVLIGLVLGILFGYLLSKIRNKWVDRLIQLLFSLGLCIPIYFLGIICQLIFGIQLDLFPTSGYKNPAYSEPTFITGSRIFDSLLSGELTYIGDYLYHLILPWIVLSLFTTILITRQVRSNLKNNSNGSFISHVLKLGINFGLILALSFLVEITFNFHGLFEAIYIAILYSNYFLCSGAILIIVITFIAVLFLSLFASSIWQRLSKSRKLIKKSNEGEPRNDTLLIFLKKQLKSPITILGLILVLFVIVIAIFPQILTPYTIFDATGVLGNPYYPPSPNHPLGQTEFGRDVLARIIYGLQSSLSIGFGIFIFALILGIIIGGVIIVFKIYFKPVYQWLNYGLITSIVLAYVIPSIIFLPYIIRIIPNIFIMMTIIGLYIAPFFALVISKTGIDRENFKAGLINIVKRLIVYTPVIIVLMIFIYESFGFLQFIGISIHLSQDIAIARGHIVTAPWAFIYPGVALSIYTLGFLLLHFGLKEGLDTRLRE